MFPVIRLRRKTFFLPDEAGREAREPRRQSGGAAEIALGPFQRSDRGDFDVTAQVGNCLEEYVACVNQSDHANNIARREQGLFHVSP